MMHSLRRGHGGVIGADNIPTSTAAPGYWTANAAARQAGGIADALFWPGPRDANFSSVSLLLHFDDWRGLVNKGSATNMVPYYAGATVSAQQSTAQTKFAAASAKISSTGGGNQVLLTPDAGLAFGAGDFTIEAWFYFTTLVAANLWDFRTAGNSVCPLIGLSTGGNITYFVSNATRIDSGASAVTTGAWTHIAVTRSGSSAKMFINGTQAGSTYTDSNTYTQNGCALGNSNTQVGLGSAPMNGYIAEARITKGVARYTANFTAPTTRFPDY